jgi:hypothetical protein
MDAGWIYNLNLIALTGNIRKHHAYSVPTALLVEISPIWFCLIRKEFEEYEISSLSCFFSCYVVGSFIHQQRVFVVGWLLFPLREDVWVLYIQFFSLSLSSPTLVMYDLQV